MAKSEVTKTHKQDVITEEDEANVPSYVPNDAAPQPKFGDAKTQELALKIYLAFGATLSYRTLKNEPMPSWDDMHPLERDAWINAAFAAQTGR